MATVIAGKYELIRRLGSGGMAEVFLARQTGAADFEKIVALKSILPHLGHDPAIVEMLIDEARIAARLDHGNIVPVYDFGIDGELPYIVMQFVHGVSLREALDASARRGERLPFALVCYVLANACRGLDYAHRRTGADGRSLNIVHRDLDPQNLMLSFEGEVKIADFGIARAETQHHHTLAGVVKGKLLYMAPEMLLRGEVDQRSDLFSLGVVLYEAAAGKKPFDDNEGRKWAIERVAAGDYLPATIVNPTLPTDVDAVIAKALAARPEQRFQSAHEMLRAIEALADRLPARHDADALAEFLGARFAERKAAPVAAAEATEATIAAPWRPPGPAAEPTGAAAKLTPTAVSGARRRRTPWRIVFPIAAIVLAAVLAAIYYGRSPAASPNLAAPGLPPAPEPPPIAAPAPDNVALEPTADNRPAPSPSRATPEPPPASHPTPTPAPPKKGGMAGPPAVVDAAPDGRIKIVNDVGCDVYLDGKLVGATPLTPFVAGAGPHEVRLSNANLGLSRTIAVAVEPGATTTIDVSLMATLVVNVDPWAKVYLDGAELGQTPFKPVPVKPGVHQIRLVNEPLGKDIVMQRTFKAGAVTRIDENLAK